MKLRASNLSNWAVVRRLCALAWRYRLACVTILALQTAAMVLAIAAIQLGGRAIDVVREQAIRTPTDSGAMVDDWSARFGSLAGEQPMAQVVLLATAMVVLGLVRTLVSYAYAVTSARLVHQQIVATLRCQVYEKLQRLSLRFYSEHATGTIINRVTGDVQAARTFIDGVLLQLAILAVSLGVYITCMVQIHAGLTAVCLATTPIIWVLGVRFSQRIRPMYDRTKALFDGLILHAVESIEGAAVIKSLGLQRQAMQRFDAITDQIRDQQDDVFIGVSRFSPTVQFLTQINLVVLLIYGGYLVSQGQLPLGSGLIVFAGLLQQFSNQVGNLSGLAGTLQQALSGARRVFEVLDAEEEVASPPQGYVPRKSVGEISLERISFAFAGAPVLDEISLSVQPGERVGIVGEVGAGKTTLLSLLPRFFDASTGVVSIDGIDVRHWDLQSLRRAVTLVPQEPLMLSNTIAANIAFGQPDAPEDSIRAAARIAGIADFIESLPDAYQTLLGQHGMSLSGGQKQRLSLARALVVDPAILLLDDPLSGVDPETEHEVVAALEQVTRGRTTLIAAHRLSTVSWTDRILVLEGGRIVAEGTHTQLIARPGLYRQFALSQGYLDHDRKASISTSPLCDAA